MKDFNRSFTPAIHESIYEKLSKFPLVRKSYTHKFLFVSFLGIHIPLIGLICFVVLTRGGFSKATVIITTLILTLFATAITLYILNGLLSPLRKSVAALQRYRQNRQLPELPVTFNDEAGLLMQNIQASITELNDLLEEKKDLTSLLSHDLRTPIRNIKTLGHVLQEGKHRETVPEIAGMIIQSAEEQSQLLESILDIIKQDHLLYTNFKTTGESAATIINSVADSFASAAALKNITIQVKIDFEGTVDVQKDLFTQVLKNLLSNAIKFSVPGASIAIVLYRQEGRTIIDVRDNGIGFEHADAEHLFERFTHKGRKGTAGEASAGIGLYLSRKIIHKHKGELVAYSEGPGKGSVFSVQLN